jgi:hypothetical protein
LRTFANVLRTRMDTTTDTIEAEERYSRRTRAAVQENETQPVLIQPIINGAFDPRWQLLWRAGIEWRTLVCAPLLGPGLETPPEPTEVHPKRLPLSEQ